jgi:hypothetical protein
MKTMCRQKSNRQRREELSSSRSETFPRTRSGQSYLVYPIDTLLTLSKGRPPASKKPSVADPTTNKTQPMLHPAPLVRVQPGRVEGVRAPYDQGGGKGQDGNWGGRRRSDLGILFERCSTATSSLNATTTTATDILPWLCGVGQASCGLSQEERRADILCQEIVSIQPIHESPQNRFTLPAHLPHPHRLHRTEAHKTAQRNCHRLLSHPQIPPLHCHRQP